MSDRTPAFRHANLLLKEHHGIVAFVNTRRAESASWREIALEMRDLTDREIDLDQSTLRSWFLAGWFDAPDDDGPIAATG